MGSWCASSCRGRRCQPLPWSSSGPTTMARWASGILTSICFTLQQSHESLMSSPEFTHGRPHQLLLLSDAV